MTASKKAKDNAIDLLLDDHKNVRKLFKDFEKMHEDASPDEKQELVDQICAELTLHTKIEDQIFYPAAREAIEDDDMMNEAEVEHASATDLIEQIRGMEASDPMFDAKVTVLGEYVNHHIQEEEKEMFPKVKKAKLDLEELGQEMMEMKESEGSELLAGQHAKSKSGSSHARH